ncbi:MAG: hypothetical protein IKZ49_00310 [Alphaproteobacteria bacterium]|nr:hypothetical protein [Alphaproteobacteria bacterium]
MITGMQKFMGIEDYPSTSCKEMSYENLSAYQKYIDDAFNQSKLMALIAYKQIQGKIFQ